MPCSCCGQPKRSASDRSFWKQIKVKYIDSRDELLNYLSTLHTVKVKVDVLIVDNPSKVCSDPALLACLHESTDYLFSQDGTKLIVGDTEGFHSNRIQRWFPLRLNIVPGDPNAGTFKVKEGISQVEQLPKDYFIEYTVRKGSVQVKQTNSL